MLAVAMLGVLAPRLVAAPTIAPPVETIATIVIRTIPPPAIDRIDDDWQRADRLARVIEARRYEEIQAAADAIAPTSRYAAWVPAALALAVDQLDATAMAYAQMNMCRELGRFYARTEAAWPQGRAAMTRVYCEGRWICGTAKADGIKAAGSIEAYRRQVELDDEQRYAELVDELARALLAGDHRNALFTCGEMHWYGSIPATCLSEACNAGDLALAEVLFSYVEGNRGDRLRRTTDPDLAALRTCERAGIEFDVQGAARPAAQPYGEPATGRPYHAQPVDLVRVHPDAPPAHDGVIIDW